MTKPHKPQPPKSAAAIRAQALITKRLGLFPFGCETPAIPETGAPARRCPFLDVCQRIPQDQPVMCEVSEVDAGIDVTKPTPDYWLADTHMPLRKAYDLDWLLSPDME